MGRFRGLLEACALLAALVVLFGVVGHLHPLRRAGIAGDRLGPTSGESVADYLADASSTLSTDEDDGSMHWALTSFDTHLTVADAYAAAGGVRISQVLFEVPIDRVQTPLVAFGVTGSERSVLESPAYAAMTLHGSMGEWDRTSQIDSVSERRLRSGCACVVGVVQYGTISDLTAVASTAGVRAVEALPADAVDGKFAVSALLPQYIDTVAPLPDDGDVPPG